MMEGKAAVPSSCRLKMEQRREEWKKQLEKEFTPR